MSFRSGSTTARLPWTHFGSIGFSHLPARNVVPFVLVAVAKVRLGGDDVGPVLLVVVRCGDSLDEEEERSVRSADPDYTAIP